jgi:hypothetical protein
MAHTSGLAVARRCAAVATLLPACVSWLTHPVSLSLDDVFRPPMVSVKLPKRVLVVFHVCRATKLPSFFRLKAERMGSL